MVSYEYRFTFIKEIYTYTYLNLTYLYYLKIEKMYVFQESL